MTRLLVGYDASPSARAAIAAAGALFPGADAVVATVQPPPPTLEAGALARAALPEAMIREGIERMREQAEQHGRETAGEGASLARQANLQAAPGVLGGVSAWRTLGSQARTIDADAIVCGTRGDGPIGRVLLGSTASSLLYHADRPLLVVPAGDAARDGPVLAGYDDSDGARAALQFAAAHLRERPLVVAHAWRSPVRHTLRAKALADFAAAVDTTWEEVAAAAAEDGAAFARDLGLEASAAAPESRDAEWQTLLATAREAGAAAILVGSRGRGAIAATVLGSVACGLVHAATLPVLVVPHAVAGQWIPTAGSAESADAAAHTPA